MANLKDVAKLAGVSVATASQALNGKSVNEGTRKKVRECARMLHYVPNRRGQSLITGKSNTIHLVIFNSQRYPDFVTGSTFFYNYIMGILLESKKKGYSLSMEIKIYEDPDLDEYFRIKCSDKSADGIIVVPQFVQSYSFLPYLTTIPHVILNPCISDSRVNALVVDHELGGRIVAEAFGRGWD